MPDDNATLKDASVVREGATEVKTETKENKTVDLVDPSEKEAAELGKLFLSAGVTKDQVNDLLAAPSALNSLRYMIQNDPAQFLRELEKSDPQAGSNFQDKIADLYVERYGTKAKTEEAKTDANSELLAEIAKLKEQTTRLETAQQQRDAAIAVAAAKDRYNNRVKEMFDQEAVKNLGLTKAEAKALKSRLDSELAADTRAVERVSKGNFVDVPQVFKTLITEWAEDRKASSESAKSERERAESGAFPEFTSGADMFTVNIPKGDFESALSTEDWGDGFAQVLQKAAGKRS